VLLARHQLTYRYTLRLGAPAGQRIIPDTDYAGTKPRQGYHFGRRGDGADTSVNRGKADVLRTAAGDWFTPSPEIAADTQLQALPGKAVVAAEARRVKYGANS
jgi:hypothetical protein